MPAELRRRYVVCGGTALEWIDTGHGIQVVPLPTDILGALRGSDKGRDLVSELLGDRRRDRH
jgi:hypothetical protein